MNIFEDLCDKDIDYLINELGQNIKINDNDVLGIFSKENTNLMTKNLLNCGDLIEYNNSKYLVTSPDNDIKYNYYCKGNLQKCNYNIKFNFEGLVTEFPTIVTGKVFDTETDQYFVFSGDKIIVTLQENEDTNKIILGQRFIKMGSAWVISGINKTVLGLITLYCDKDVFIPDDDKENEIADKGKYLYNVSITNGDTASMKIGDTLQLELTVTDSNGNAVSDPQVIYSSSDESIATVDENGLITAVASGGATITVALDIDSSKYDSIDISVASVPTGIEIVGSNTVDEGYTGTYMVKNVDGTDIEGYTFNFILDLEGNPENTAIITSTTATTCTLNCNTHGQIKLTATANEDNDLTTDFWITINAGW